MCPRLLPKMKRSVARYVAGSVAIFISYSFVRIHSLSSPKSLTNQYPKVKLPEILGIWARKVEVMRLFTTPVWERSRGTPRQQFHSLLKGSCCALTWQQGRCNEWHWIIKADGIEIQAQSDKSSLPRWIKTTSRVHQQYVFSLYESADCCGRLQKLASHRLLKDCTWK